VRLFSFLPFVLRFFVMLVMLAMMYRALFTCRHQERVRVVTAGTSFRSVPCPGHLHLGSELAA
jgi:hypothetical protein